MKTPYESPELTTYGSVADITSAVGGGDDSDQSDYPQQFPPGTGSFDVCDNENPNSVC